MSVLPLVLLLAAAPVCAAAREFVCSNVRPGDTAAGLALRLTNSADNRHAPWFQILDPARSRFVAKRAYHAILPGWKVCIARDAFASRSRPQVMVPWNRPKPDQSPVSNRSAALDFVYASIVIAAVCGSLIAVPAAKKHLDTRCALLDSMSGFAAAFVGEFARPLPRKSAADRPIRARLKCAPYRARLDILVAPSEGHTYPNLTDHKKNFEYDIERVLRVVPYQPFVRGEPYSRGDWVVIPFRVAAGVKQEGAM
jgi:hypothetical protein